MTDTGPVEAKPNNNGGKKWWLIGCGGCLTVLIVLVIGLVVLGGWGFNAVKQASDGTAKELLGSRYQPPEGSTMLGLPLGQKELKNLVFIVNAERGTFVLVADTILPPEASRILKQGNSKQISNFIKQVSAQASSSREAQAHMNVSDLRIDAIRTIKLKNGKDIPFCYVWNFNKDKGTYAPSVVALLPEANQRLIVVMGLNPRNTSTDPEVDFNPAYKKLETTLLEVITNSELANRLQ